MSKCYPHNNQKEETQWKATKIWRKGSKKDDNKKKIHRGVRLQESVCPTERSSANAAPATTVKLSWRWRWRTTSRRIS
jgi:hypothetical protein